MTESITSAGRRDAITRSAATTCLTGIALIETLGVPALWAQGRPLALLSMAVCVLCIGLAWALATGGTNAVAHLWCAIGATGALVLAGWVASHAFAIPGLEWAHDDWAALPGGIAAALAVTALVMAVLATAPTPATRRGLATAVVMGLFVAQTAGVLFIAHGHTGHGVPGTTTVLTSSTRLQAPGSPENSIVYKPIPGGKGGRFVYATKPAPRPTPLGLAVLVGAAAVFAGGLIGSLRIGTGAFAEACMAKQAAFRK